jgi:hypothetical protein
LLPADAAADNTMFCCDVDAYVTKHVPLVDDADTVQSIPGTDAVTLPLPLPPPPCTVMAGDRNVAVTVCGPSMNNVHSAWPAQSAPNAPVLARLMAGVISSRAVVVAGYLPVQTT